MSPSEELLEQAAQNGTFDSTEWPRVLETVLERIDHIVHNEFPIPPVMLPRISSVPTASPARPQTAESADPSSTSTQPSDTNTTTTQQDPPSSPPNNPDTSVQLPPSEQVKATAITLPPGTLPAPLHATLVHVKTTLSANFPSHPPHTIQRLAELVLYPKQHYRLLHKYLNALHRVVSVSSDCTIYPLPTLDLPGGILVNGTSHAPPSTRSHDDDSLGGALLTPIPWLVNGSSRSRSASLTSLELDRGHTTNGVSEGQTQDLDGDADTSMTMEEQLRENGGVTQGELLRQEQEASDPPAPVGSSANRDHVIAAAVAPTSSATDETKEAAGDAEGGEQPHARGPAGIGAEDIGNQEHAVGIGQVLDLQAAVGRAPETGRRGSKDDEGDETVQQKPDEANEAQASTDRAGSADQAQSTKREQSQDTPKQHEREVQEDVSMTE